MRTETYFRTCNHCRGVGHCHCEKCKEIRGGEIYDGPCHECSGTGGWIEPLFREHPYLPEDCAPFQDFGPYGSRF
ncbi:MAG: hypothetical protein NT154_18005 [Verrucomicrobia bacterium]|nr:hypothetical protein [Verrucomicrobiota bacterium]